MMMLHLSSPAAAAGNGKRSAAADRFAIPSVPRRTAAALNASSSRINREARLNIATRAAAAQEQQQQEQQQQRPAVKPEGEVPGMSAYLDGLKWNSDGLVAVIAQVGCSISRWVGRAISGCCCSARRGDDEDVDGAHAPRRAAADALADIAAPLSCVGAPSFMPGNPAPQTPPPQQHVDTGEVLMQAYADRNAICETLQTG